MRDLDVNGPHLGELHGFPQRWEWSSIRAMMECVWECKKMFAEGKSFQEVDTFWRQQFERDNLLR